MASYNKVLLMGNLTRDPELRYSGSGGGGGSGGGSGGGNAICKFGLAVNSQWRDAQGQQHEETTFVDITTFGRQAETCNEFLKKGRPVFVDGRLKFSQWDDRETGKKRSKLDVVADRVQFLGSRDGSPGGGGPREAVESSAPTGAPAGASGPRAPRAPAPGGGGGEGVDFDDIPF